MDASVVDEGKAFRNPCKGRYMLDAGAYEMNPSEIRRIGSDILRREAVPDHDIRRFHIAVILFKIGFGPAFDFVVGAAADSYAQLIRKVGITQKQIVHVLLLSYEHLNRASAVFYMDMYFSVSQCRRLLLIPREPPC